MHPRNMYNVPPDFSKLAINYPEFLKISTIDLNGTVRINFKEPNTLLVLTKCLLHADFGLDVDIPSDRLVPTIPLRLNYLLWLEDILNAAGRKENVKGIDIGTGACCIYPLLAARKLQWHMMATEVDENSVNMALKNIKQNNLQRFISVKKVVNNTQLLMHCFKTFGGSLEEVDFCMCNPPFYSSIHDMDLARSTERPPPRTARTGSLKEIVTEGGEVSFVTKLIQESLILKNKIRIYTTMLGHKSSLKPLLRILKGRGITQVAQTVFSQGKTTRWGLAWSFMESSKVLNSGPPPKKNTKGKCMSFVVPPIVGINYQVKEITFKLLQIFKELELHWKLLQQKDVISTLEVKATKNTWSNQRKLRREQMFKDQQDLKNCGIDAKPKEMLSPEDNINVCKKQDGHILSPQKTNLFYTDNNAIDVKTNQLKRKNEDCLDTIKNNVLCSPSKTCKIGETTNELIPVKRYDKDAEMSSSSNKTASKLVTDSSHSPSKDAIVAPVAGCSYKAVPDGPDYLTAAVSVRNNEDYIVLEIGYVSGEAGKDGVHQIVQYIKNNWK